MRLEELRKKLPEIFEQVKKDVWRVLKRRRAGLSLGLAEIGLFRGGFIGGLYFSGGTMIIMNTTPLRLILENYPEDVALAYVYHILLHEYIHSLGYLDEAQTRILTIQVTKEVFKDAKHPARIISEEGLTAFFPRLPLIYAPADYQPIGVRIDLVKEFDRGSKTYFI
ncbi:MAG: hypothetical protein OdinLCB4_003460 [Candidatus Odinarchaeum yellowstonii]|uniref:Uncharacterized protein n=1 Tax=Odinarchaeota yellowstonii (strain LCB_4) TaxID=1841599 RepID=A0AAF0IC34_ODILC|nr:MAG: hypothetical protein OdinLCB4_003460 [Candidatus Odinarchaeum yellowstonii]